MGYGDAEYDWPGTAVADNGPTPADRRSARGAVCGDGRALHAGRVPVAAPKVRGAGLGEFRLPEEAVCIRLHTHPLIWGRSSGQLGRRGRRSSHWPERARAARIVRLRRRSSSLARSRSSLRPTSRNTRSTAPPSPADIRTMVRICPATPPTKTAQALPARTSARADPKVSMRERGAMVQRYTHLGGGQRPASRAGTGLGALPSRGALTRVAPHRPRGQASLPSQALSSFLTI
jgi:hypothetical protein